MTPEEEVPENPPNFMQQVLGMLTEQRTMILELREELQEVKAKQNKEGEQSETEDSDHAETENEESEPNDEPPHPEGQPNLSQNNQPPPYRETLQYWITELNKHQLSVFEGRFDPEEAENWMLRLEKIFQVLECPAEKKAPMAIYMLREDVDRW